MHALELKIPPIVLTLLVAAAMWGVAIAIPSFDVLLLAKDTIASLLVLGGIAVALLGVASFRRAGTTVDPMAPQAASALVSQGIYRLTRNPMYLGFLLALSGWAVYLSHAGAFALLPAFVLYMNRF